MSRSAAVVVVNYGAHDLLDRHLSPLGDSLTVVVVDNWSGAAERAAVEDLAAARGWQLVAPDGNEGFGAGVNLGVERATALGCQQLLLLNPDAVVTPEVASALTGHVREHPDELVCPRIETSAGQLYFAGATMALRSGEMRLPQPGDDPRLVRPWLTGACLAVSTELFRRIGGFVEPYFLYWEDVDLSFRAAEAGARLVVRHDLVAVHDEGGTHDDAVAGPAKSALYYRWNARNRLLFATRNLPTGTMLAWLVHTPAQSWAILLRGGRRQLVHSPAPLWAIVRGSVAGAGLVLRELACRAVRRGRPHTPRPT